MLVNGPSIIYNKFVMIRNGKLILEKQLTDCNDCSWIYLSLILTKSCNIRPLNNTKVYDKQWPHTYTVHPVPPTTTLSLHLWYWGWTDEPIRATQNTLLSCSLPHSWHHNIISDFTNSPPHNNNMIVCMNLV